MWKGEAVYMSDEFEWRMNVDFDLIRLVRKKARDRGMGWRLIKMIIQD